MEDQQSRPVFDLVAYLATVSAKSLERCQQIAGTGSLVSGAKASREVRSTLKSISAIMLSQQMRTTPIEADVLLCQFPRMLDIVPTEAPNLRSAINDLAFGVIIDLAEPVYLDVLVAFYRTYETAEVFAAAGELVNAIREAGLPVAGHVSDPMYMLRGDVDNRKVDDAIVRLRALDGAAGKVIRKGGKNIELAEQIRRSQEATEYLMLVKDGLLPMPAAF
jgi:hypothetical protein